MTLPVRCQQFKGIKEKKDAQAQIEVYLIL